MKNLLMKRKVNTLLENTCPAELDLSFYRHWYKDLGALSDARLIRHWQNEGKQEERSPNFDVLLSRDGLIASMLPDDFASEMYVKLNPDVATECSTHFHATYHFLKTGSGQGRQYRFDRAFYLSLYDEFGLLTKADDAMLHWLHHGKHQGFFPTLDQLLASYGIEFRNLPFDFELENLARLNPDENFSNLFLAIFQIVQQSPARKLRPHDADHLCADFYVQLALHQERTGHINKAIELYGLSLLFFDNPTAHEHLGNIALNYGNQYQAIAHYEVALEVGTRSQWVPLNLAKALTSVGQFGEAVEVLIRATELQPNIEMLTLKLQEVLTEFWRVKEQSFNSLATAQRRASLMKKTEDAVSFVADSFSRLFTKFSPAPYRGSINKSRVLIIGSFGLAQCYRYRIAQKQEQLRLASYDVETVNYLDSKEAINLINYNDLIIFYRIPAAIETIHMIEYARALGKITFYDIDDLLIDACNPPPIESYGGQVSPHAYVNLVKDTALFRAAATRCDYAISSTEPLLQRLTALVRTKRGFLHRNALDDHILPIAKDSREKKYVSIFYGTGTLAHNSDFTQIALPAIDRLLEKHRNVKFVAVGHLKLPETFLARHKQQVVQLAIMQHPQVYLNCLSAADINIAVLHDDIINDCKSEIKWMEAGFFGIPSVVSATKNYCEVIENGADGYLASNEQEWFSCLERLVVDPALRERVGLAAEKKVKDRYTPASLAKNIDGIMNSSIAHQSLPFPVPALVR
ncbi:glycosyltransferase [Paraburkholderia sp. RP-4-7]|uniref:Glycosyltransferase n=1 Tax=Paraburkholderia polaris TaxID=2728848 RepID=A0A848II56_9BURK|nr:glycosyltransferase [Paraburkholderia polaris]NMM01952.1 glycosyltransferase [Paraburkholderia polaris]